MGVWTMLDSSGKQVVVYRGVRFEAHPGRTFTVAVDRGSTEHERLIRGEFRPVVERTNRIAMAGLVGAE